MIGVGVQRTIYLKMLRDSRRYRVDDHFIYVLVPNQPELCLSPLLALYLDFLHKWAIRA
jgi:hypothetical protein